MRSFAVELWKFILLFTLVQRATLASESCSTIIKIDKCYKTNPYQFNLLFNDRMQISWREYAVFLPRLVCKCAEAARNAGFAVYGIQFYGECWAANLSTAMLVPATDELDCVGTDFDNCNSNSAFCTGAENTIHVYTVEREKQQMISPVDGGYNIWGDWSQCSVSCGNGQQSRERTCDMPLPSFGGQNCEALGPATETTKCSLGECIPSYQFTSAGCSRAIKGDLIDFYASSMAFGTFCRSSYVLPQPSNPTTYQLTASLFSRVGPMGVLDGNSGFTYNVQDLNNFQYIYFMFSSTRNCYTTGTVRNGMDDFFASRRKKCAPLMLFGNQWVDIEISVDQSQAQIKVNNVNIDPVPNSLDMLPRGGAVLRNGERNEVYFKNIKLA